MQGRNLIERRYAEFYRLYAAAFRADIPIYLEMAAKHPGPVLEVGCRTGRVAGALGRAGHQVLAIDTWRPMLELAVHDLRDCSEAVRIADFDLRRQPTPERHTVGLVTLFAFNDLIDVEEQRLFLRHLRSSLASPGIALLDLFCPLSVARPDQANETREIEFESGDHQLKVSDRREMLTPLLERRIRSFSVDDAPPLEHTSHRRFITPSLAANLLAEAGFDELCWVQGYDLSTLEPIPADSRATGPFLVIGRV